MDLLTAIGFALMDHTTGIELEPVIPVERPEEDGGLLSSARFVTTNLESA